MNRIIIIPSLLFILSAFTCKEQPKNKLEKITFHYVDLDIETPIQVSCDYFETFFADSFKTVTVDNNTGLVEFEKILLHHEILDTVKKIDVRVKLIIKYANKKISTLCMDRFNHLILDNNPVNSDKKIIDFIKTYTK